MKAAPHLVNGPTGTDLSAATPRPLADTTDLGPQLLVALGGAAPGREGRKGRAPYGHLLDERHRRDDGVGAPAVVARHRRDDLPMQPFASIGHREEDHDARPRSWCVRD